MFWHLYRFNLLFFADLSHTIFKNDNLCRLEITPEEIFAVTRGSECQRPDPSWQVIFIGWRGATKQRWVISGALICPIFLEA